MSYADKTARWHRRVRRTRLAWTIGLAFGSVAYIALALVAFSYEKSGMSAGALAAVFLIVWSFLR